MSKLLPQYMDMLVLLILTICMCIIKLGWTINNIEGRKLSSWSVVVCGSRCVTVLLINCTTLEAEGSEVEEDGTLQLAKTGWWWVIFYRCCGWNFLFLVCFFNPVHWLVGGIIAIPAGNASNIQDSRCSRSSPGRATHKLVDVADNDFNR